MSCLLKYRYDSKSYFEHIIENIKNGNLKVKIQGVKKSSSLEYHIDYYLILAKHDMLKYIKDLDEDDLLLKDDNKTLLEGLLEADSDLTLNKILTNSVKSNPKIAILLKSMGFEQKNINISDENNNFANEYIDNFQNTMGIGPLFNEGELLLNKLKQLFLSDGKSDKDLIEGLISGYRHSLFINYEVNLKELQQLIEIKEKNLDKFFYIKEADSGYFSPSNGSVFCDNSIIEVLLHETGHALHYYIAQKNTPDNYKELTEKARKNPNILRKTAEYANDYDTLYNSILSIVTQKSKSFFDTYYTEDRIEKIKTILQKSRNDKKAEFISLGIPEEQLDILLENSFTVEEYIEHQKRIFIKENVDAIMRSEFGPYISISDILDAIYEGSLHNSNLMSEDGEKIKATGGHGINYYFCTDHGFDEMIANFAFISKSKDSLEMLQLLKDIIGDELYTMLSEFYYNNIVYSNEKQIEERKHLGGK